MPVFCADTDRRPGLTRDGAKNNIFRSLYIQKQNVFYNISKIRKLCSAKSPTFYENFAKSSVLAGPEGQLSPVLQCNLDLIPDNEEDRGVTLSNDHHVSSTTEDVVPDSD